MKQKKLVFEPILTPPPPSYGKEKVKGFRNPYILVYRAATLYNDYLVHESKRHKTLFIISADPLVNNLVIQKDFGVWPFYHLFWRARQYGCKIPWVSALAQGQGISVLVRAYNLVNKKKYLIAAKHALEAFRVTMNNGGVLSIDSDDGDWWYEEYASAYSKPSGVLNGFILALLGLHDFHLMSGNSISEQLFNKGISTLRHHLDDFDTNSPFKLTYYDRQKHIVAIPYHLLHIKLMKILHEITKEEIFKIYQKKWERYKEEWFTHRMHRWLSKFYYVRSGYSFGDSVKLFLRLTYGRNLF